MGCTGCKNKQLNTFGMGQRIGQLARGVKGMASYAIGKTQVHDADIEFRQRSCENCPAGFYNFGICDENKGGCGCTLFYKIRVAVEQCPKGYWGQVTPKSMKNRKEDEGVE